MSKQFKLTKQFKKDLKRIQNNPVKIQNLEKVLHLLKDGISLPSIYKPHPLIGNYQGYMECHVENDSLLIWMDETGEIIKLIRYGSHSELF